MSDKGRKQEDRSVKSTRGPAVPHMVTSHAGLVPHYAIPSDASHLHPHPHHAIAYSMMHSTLGMGPPLGIPSAIPGKGRPSPTLSNDLGPPIFMPSLNLGVPKGPTSLSSGTHTKNSISQSSMSSTLMSDILSNAPTPFQPLSGFHTTTGLRPGQPYMHPHHVVNTTTMPPRVTYHGATTTVNARSNPVLVSAGNVQGEDATVTKVVSGGQGHKLQSSISRTAPSSAMNKLGPTSTKVTTPEGEFPNVTHLTYAQVPPSHMTVHTVPYIPGHGVMVPTVQQHPMGGGSTLSKMLLTPASPNVRHQRASDHLHHHSSSHDPMAASRLPISATSSSMTSSSQSSASQRSGGLAGTPPEGYPGRNLGQTTFATSGLASSTASYVDTRTERPPQPSAVAGQQTTAASTVSRTTAEVASDIIISVPGLTGKHIAQITNNVPGATPPYPPGPHQTEPYRGTMEIEPMSPTTASSMLQSLTSGVINFHQTSKAASMPQAASNSSPSTALTGSPGGNSSPRPRILRPVKRTVEGNRKADGPMNSPGSSSSLVNKQLSFGTSKQGSATTPPGSTPGDHLLHNSTSQLKRPLSPVSDGLHNHLGGGTRTDSSDSMVSPRKKPRKQNVVANDDQYASNVPDRISDSLVSESGRPTMATRSRTRAEGTHHVEEGPKEVEFRYLSQLRRSPWPINGVYKIHHRAAHNHFKRHADIKHREDECVSAYDIACEKSSEQRASGWKLCHFSSQLDEMSKVEGEILAVMQRLQKSVENLDKCASCTSEELQDYRELIQGNVDRSMRIISHMDETKASMFEVLDHKPHTMELLRKYGSGRLSISGLTGSKLRS